MKKFCDKSRDTCMFYKEGICCYSMSEAKNLFGEDSSLIYSEYTGWCAYYDAKTNDIMTRGDDEEIENWFGCDHPCLDFVEMPPNEYDFYDENGFVIEESAWL